MWGVGWGLGAVGCGLWAGGWGVRGLAFTIVTSTSKRYKGRTRYDAPAQRYPSAGRAIAVNVGRFGVEILKFLRLLKYCEGSKRV